MPFVDERFDVIHKLLIQQNLVVLPGPFNSQADVFKAWRHRCWCPTIFQFRGSAN